MGVSVGQIIIIVLISILIFGDLPKLLKTLKLNSEGIDNLKKKQ
jgi:Sec-independent protein translocase protein TatA